MLCRATGAPVPSGADAVVQIENTEQPPAADDGRRRVRIKIVRILFLLSNQAFKLLCVTPSNLPVGVGRFQLKLACSRPLYRFHHPGHGRVRVCGMTVWQATSGFADWKLIHFTHHELLMLPESNA